MGTDNSKNGPKVNPAGTPVTDCTSPLTGQEKLPTQCVENQEGHEAVMIYEDKTFMMTKQSLEEEVKSF